MTTIQQIMTEYGTSNNNKIDEASKHCATNLLHLMFPKSIDSISDAQKELALSDIYQSVHKLKSLNSKFKRGLIDSVNRQLYGKDYYSKPKHAGFVDSEIVRAKSLLHGAAQKVDAFITKQQPLSNHHRLFLVLFHAAFESGLCFEEGLDALLRTLTTSKTVAEKVGATWVISLTYSRRGHETNTRKAKKKVTERNFQPGPLTLFAIAGYIKSRSIACVNEDATTLLKNELAKIISNEALIQLKSRTFLRAITMLISEQPGSQMPSFLRHFASGDLSSASTSIECFRCMNTQTFHKETALPAEQDKPQLKSKQTALYQKKRDFPAYQSDFNKALRQFFKNRNDVQKTAKERKVFVIRAIDEFHEQRQHTMSDAESVFIDWMRYCYEVGNLTKFSAGARYVSCVATIWLATCNRTSVFVLDDTEMTVMYDELLSRKSLSDSQFVDLITDLIYFLYEEHDIPLPQQLEPRDKTRAIHVRSNIPSKNHIKQLLIDINEVYSSESSHFRESVTAMLILCARTNIRPHEAMNLEIKDVSTFEKGHIFIRTNRHFKEKTYSAKRLIELDTFLPGDESSHIRQFINRRMEQAGRYLCADGRLKFEKPHTLLFSKLPQCNAFLDMRGISKHVTQLLSSYTGAHVPMYQLRHFSISTAMLVCFASDVTVQALTSYSSAQIAAIREYFQLHDSLNILYKISNWAGHLDSSMTLSTYTHVCDLLLFESIMRSDAAADIDVIRNLSSMQPARIKKQLPDDVNVKALNKATVMQLVDRLLSKERGGFAATQHKGINKGDINMDSLFSKKTTFDAEQVSSILEAFDKGHPFNAIRDIYNIELRMIEAVVDTARNIKERYKTKRKRRRLYGPQTSKIQVPGPRSTDDLMAAYIIINHLMPAPMQHLDEDVRKASHILLNASQYGHSDISFNTKEVDDAIMLLTVLKSSVPAPHFFLEVHVDNSICEDPVEAHRDDVLNAVKAHWHYVMDAVGQFDVILQDGGKRQNPFGIARLYFMTKEIDENNAHYVKGNADQYASGTLRYAFHTLAIYSGALRRYYDPEFKYDPNNIYKITRLLSAV